jgi:two-component system chemotaxis sensor kinase CheA
LDPDEQNAASRERRRERLYLELGKRAATKTNIGAAVINTMILLWTWGHWRQFVIALGLYAVILPANIAIDRLLPRHGIRIEIGRALFNQSICAVVYQWIGWPLPVWLWMPFIPLGFDSMGARQSVVVLALSCGVQDVAALVGGVSPEIPLVFTTLAVMAWILVNARMQIIREMLVVADERADELAKAQQTLQLEILARDELAKALDARTRQMRLVFDQVEQGLLVVDLEGVIAADHSAIIETWLGPMPSSHRLVDLVRELAPDRADWFGLAWSALADDAMPIELAVTQLPASFTGRGRQLAWSYKPFELPDGSTRILVVISDRTAELAHARDERRDRETVSLLLRAARDRAGFVDVCGEVARLVAAIEASDAASSPAFGRDIHTLKGVAGLLELASLADACHQLETAIAESDETAVDTQRTAISARWREIAELVEPLLDRTESRIDVDDRDVVELEAAIARGAPATELANMVARWRDERAEARLKRVGEFAASLAARLDKAPIAVEIDCSPSLRVPAAIAPIWSALAHAVRNAIDHGIESPSARRAAGKRTIPTLRLRAIEADGELLLELADDGPGIDWNEVAASAAARGVSVASRADLEAALFCDGVSTTPSPTETSGRGVGLAAVRATANELGAAVTLTSEPGRGTSLKVAWRQPVSAFLARAS